MASIAKRPLAKGVAFDVRYRDPNGRPRMKTFRRAEDARLFAKTIEADVVRGDYLQPALARSRFDRWADEWLCSTADLRPKTRVGYESMLRVNVLPHFGSWPVGRIEAVHVRQYLADLRSAGAGPGTVRAARKILRLVLATAIEGGALRANPCAGIRLARSEPVEMAFLTMEQVLALAGAMRRPEYGLLVRFAALSGLRAGEIGAMRVGRLDLVRSRVDVAESVAEVTGYGLVYGSPKTYERRSVPIPRTLAEELGAHLAGRPQQPEDFVFTAPGGGPLRHHNFYRRHFKPALAAAGLPQRVRFHDMRHTCAALLINADPPAHPLAVMKRLGHSSITVTYNTYGHLFPALEAALTESLDRSYQAAQAPRMHGTPPMTRWSTEIRSNDIGDTVRSPGRAGCGGVGVP